MTYNRVVSETTVIDGPRRRKVKEGATRAQARTTKQTMLAKCIAKLKAKEPR